MTQLDYLGFRIPLLLLPQLLHVVVVYGHLVGREDIHPVQRPVWTQRELTHLGPQQDARSGPDGLRNRRPRLGVSQDLEARRRSSFRPLGLHPRDDLLLLDEELEQLGVDPLTIPTDTS